MGNSHARRKELKKEVEAMEVVTRKDLEAMEVVTRKDLEAMEERLVNQRKYENGDYYRSLKSEMWHSDSVDFEGAAKEWKECRQSDREAIRYYVDPKARGDDEVRYYKNKFVPHTLFPVGDQSMAHLIPNDPSCSLAWLRAVSIVTGIGVGADVACPLLDEKLRTFVEGRAPEEGMTTDVDAPLKTWNWNFLMLPEDHQKHFDKLARNRDEQLILSPIWDPKVDEWKPGTGYKVMVAASPKTYQWLLGKEMPSTERSKQYEWLMEASPSEPKKATAFLALTVRALADLLFTYGENDLEIWSSIDQKTGAGEGEADTPLESVFKAIEGAIPSDMLSQRSYHSNSSAGNSSSEKTTPVCKKKAKDFVAKIKAVNNVRKRNLESNEKKHVQIPLLLESNTKPTLVVDLGVYFKGREHLIPDPFLVVLKAAVSWSSFRDQKLLPACGNHSDHHQENIPAEIFAIAGEDASQGDDDSVISISESLTGPPGDGNFEASTVSPSGKTSVRVITP